MAPHFCTRPHVAQDDACTAKAYGYHELVDAGGPMAYEGTLANSRRAWPMMCTRSSTGSDRARSDLSRRQILFHHQPESRQRPRPHVPAIAARSRRRGHRMRHGALGLLCCLPPPHVWVRALERARQHWILITVPAGPVAGISTVPSPAESRSDGRPRRRGPSLWWGRDYRRCHRGRGGIAGGPASWSSSTARSRLFLCRRPMGRCS
jgi:hypothetical protein